MTVICELIGVPDLDRDAFRGLSNGVITPASPLQEMEAVRAMSEYLRELIEDKRCSPGDDLMSALVRTRDEEGDRLSPDELVGMAFLLLVAGHETTVNLIANGVRALLDHPGQLAALRDDPELTGGAVEEMLRYDGPVENATFRYPREQVEIGQRTVPAGAPVLVSLVAPTGTGPATRNRTPSTSAATPGATWPSGTAPTSAWVRRWPGWRAGSRSVRCWSAAPPSPGTRRRGSWTGFPGC